MRAVPAGEKCEGFSGQDSKGEREGGLFLTRVRWGVAKR